MFVLAWEPEDFPRGGFCLIKSYILVHFLFIVLIVYEYDSLICDMNLIWELKIKLKIELDF